MDRKINRIYLSVSWLVLTVSLGIWWFALGLRQAEQISQLTEAMGEPFSTMGDLVFEKQSRMIWMEGTFFISLLTLGGSLLIWFSYRDIQRNRLIQDFFSTVTHEMKTPLAGLRLQVEGLLQDLGEDSTHSPALKRAVRESDRIESQMEKAFYLASIMRSEYLYLEKTQGSELKRLLEEVFPDVKWSIPPGMDILSDKKALESILRNLIENAYKHGMATLVEISFEKYASYIIITIQDNGQGFQGDWKKLGKPFVRHSSTSGTGIGIYIIRGLMDKMNGQVSFSSDNTGFRSVIRLPVWKEAK